MDLATAQNIITAALAYGAEHHLKPLAAGVLDARGVLMAYSAQPTDALRRSDIVLGKASGALALGMGSRALMKRAEAQPYFIAAVNGALGGALVPVPGGVLIKSGSTLLGAVGISGDSSDNDEAAAIAGIIAVGLEADPG